VEGIARACSPRVAPQGLHAAVFDASGLERACGPPEVIAREVERMAVAQGLTARVAVATTMTTAWILAHARPGVTVACGERGRAALAELPVAWLATVFDLDRAIGARLLIDGPAKPARGESMRRGRARNYRVAPPPSSAIGSAGANRAPAVRVKDREIAAICRDRLATFERWGVRTCGALADLARADVHARMGPVGVRLHQAAHGEDVEPLVPVPEAAVFADRVELEWPIEGLEPLTFVLARQCERLSSQLERADRGAVAIHTTLTLVTRETHERHLALPAPLRDARVLRTLIGLDLETHAPEGAIDVVEIRLDVTPGRILQGSLLAWAVPSPEDLSTLLARLGALVGESRVGAPVCPNTHDLRQVAMAPFQVTASDPPPDRAGKRPEVDLDACRTLRRFRLPLAARVTVEHGTPREVWPSARGLAGGRVVVAAGPWRSSGLWWAPAFAGGSAETDERGAAWDRDEWDVELPDGVVYRLARQRSVGSWEIEGVFD
jgi:protein ImuB